MNTPLRWETDGTSRIPFAVYTDEAGHRHLVGGQSLRLDARETVILAGVGHPAPPAVVLDVVDDVGQEPLIVHHLKATQLR